MAPINRSIFGLASGNYTTWAKGQGTERPRTGTGSGRVTNGVIKKVVGARKTPQGVVTVGVSRVLAPQQNNWEVDRAREMEKEE